MTTSNLTLDDFARLFGTLAEDIPVVCRKIIDTRDFRYQKLDSQTRDRVLTGILKQIDSGDMWVSGPRKKDIWEKGWSENLQDYEKEHDVSSLTPKFINPCPILRLDRDFIQPLDSDFEFNFVDVYRHWAFLKYLSDVRAIYEFGCGSCQHLPVLAQLFSEKEIHGLDWAISSTKIIKELVNETGWNITGHLFDLYSPDESLLLNNNCGVFTIGTMEQLGPDFKPFLQFLIQKRPAVVMHMETIREMYDDSYLTDYLALRYDMKRNYLRGYSDHLKQLEAERQIVIMKEKRIFFGSMYHDSYSLLVWKPN